MRLMRVLLASLLGYFAMEALVFHTHFYASFLRPDSSAGNLETLLSNEMRREVKDRNQVLAVGDSRMLFMPRYANEMKLGYTFATINTPASTPRCWYYMLRDVDPTRRRYTAIIIPVDDYDDAEGEDRADRLLDLHFLIARLRLSDLAEFSSSYHTPSRKREVAASILLKGLVYKTDVQDFLENPAARLNYVNLSWRESHNWFYDYVGTSDNMTGVSIDWARRVITVPANVKPESKEEYKAVFLSPRPPDRGLNSAYLKNWFGKIYGLYRGSGTRLIFMRIPRGPFVRPDQPTFNPHSSVRELAKMPEVMLDDEHFFDDLEKPEFFWDAMHLNAAGIARFSHMLARHLVELLGPAEPGA
jgi:hypothetical protein